MHSLNQLACMNRQFVNFEKSSCKHNLHILQQVKLPLYAWHHLPIWVKPYRNLLILQRTSRMSPCQVALTLLKVIQIISVQSITFSKTPNQHSFYLTISQTSPWCPLRLAQASKTWTPILQPSPSLKPKQLRVSQSTTLSVTPRGNQEESTKLTIHRRQLLLFIQRSQRN